MFKHDNPETSDEVAAWLSGCLVEPGPTEDPANHEDDGETDDTDKVPPREDKGKPGDDRWPPWKWHGYLYHDGTDVAIPAENIMSMIGRAVMRSSLRGKTRIMRHTQSDIQIATEFCEFRANVIRDNEGNLVSPGHVIKMADIRPLRDQSFVQQREAVKQLGLELSLKRRRVSQYAKHVRVEPIVHNWTVTADIMVTGDILTTPLLAQILAEAGVYEGLGDRRPGSLKAVGRNGMFKAMLEQTD